LPISEFPFLTGVKGRSSKKSWRIIKGCSSRRKQLLELRRFRFSGLDLNSDLKMIEQKKVAFASTWKAADSLKDFYNEKLDEVKTLRKTFAILSKESREKTELWHNDKRIVMKMYGELRSEVKISNPRKVLLKSTME